MGAIHSDGLSDKERQVRAVKNTIRTHRRASSVSVYSVLRKGLRSHCLHINCNYSLAGFGLKQGYEPKGLSVGNMLFPITCGASILKMQSLFTGLPRVCMSLFFPPMKVVKPHYDASCSTDPAVETMMFPASFKVLVRSSANQKKSPKRLQHSNLCYIVLYKSVN